MKKNTVKILKKDELSRAVNEAQNRVADSDSETKNPMSVAQTVGGWIAEWRVNSEAKCAESVDTVIMWKRRQANS